MLETPEVLLSRIRNEREMRYAEAIQEWNRAMTVWCGRGEATKQRKPKLPNELEPPKNADIGDLPGIPYSWAYVRLGEFLTSIDAGNSFKVAA